MRSPTQPRFPLLASLLLAGGGSAAGLLVGGRSAPLPAFAQEAPTEATATEAGAAGRTKAGPAGRRVAEALRAAAEARRQAAEARRQAGEARRGAEGERGEAMREAAGEIREAHREIGEARREGAAARREANAERGVAWRETATAARATAAASRETAEAARATAEAARHRARAAWQVGTSVSEVVDARQRLREAIAAGDAAAIRAAAQEIRDAHREAGAALEAARDARHEAVAARVEARAARGEAREARVEAREARHDAVAATAETRWTLWRERHQQAPAFAAGRKAVRRARWQQIRAAIGAEAAPEAVQANVRAELRRHALRIAQLERIRELADDRSDKDALGRIDLVVDLEIARHVGLMGRLGVAIGEELPLELETDEAALIEAAAGITLSGDPNLEANSADDNTAGAAQ